MYRLSTDRWTTERMVFFVAGFFVFVSVILGMTHSPNWLYFTGFVGGMLMFFALTGWCPLAILLTKIGSLQSLEETHK